nr:PREDICTED: metal-nicotianamine transporter YSL1-like [Daucus carota subsp. sativus]
MACESPKEAWSTLKEEFEGNAKTKLMQVLNLKREFEMQRMKGNKTIKEYVSKLMSIVNQIRLFGETFANERVVDKILVTKFNATTVIRLVTKKRTAGTKESHSASNAKGFIMAYNYKKVALFLLAALVGKEHGVVAGLAGCGLIKSVVSVDCIVMQDLKTGHLKLTSPRAMLLSQSIGTTIGCMVAPLSFMLYYKAFDVGNPTGEFKAPYVLCYGFFSFVICINLVKYMLPKKIGKWMPLPMAMGVPFLVGIYFGISMCTGTRIVFAWEKLKPRKAELMVPAVASGLDPTILHS